MNAGSIYVQRPGLLTTVQDLGRWGFQSLGVPVAGPMDPFAHCLANALVGNDRRAATLEITLVGPELEFDDERLVAVAGAKFDMTIGGAGVPSGCPFVVPAQSRLRFGPRQHGARAYLAVEGGIDVPLVLGSRSTHVPSAMGGHAGRALARADRLLLGPPHGSRTRLASRRIASASFDREPGRVRVLPGPQRDRFDDDAIDVIQSAPYVVASESDRMGFRLLGPALRHSRGAEIISEPTMMGSLQVPGAGQPLLLMADRQTTGGYPKIATAISADLGVAGQAAPGDAISFKLCTPGEALAALIAGERALLAIEG